MDINVQKHSDINILKLHGAFRLGPAVDSFRASVEQVLHDGGPKIIVNMTEVNSVDSSGIGALVRSQTSVRQKGGAIKIVNPSKLVVQTLQFVGLLTVFEIHTDDDAAIHSFSSEGALSTKAKDPAAGWQ